MAAGLAMLAVMALKVGLMRLLAWGVVRTY